MGNKNMLPRSILSILFLISCCYLSGAETQKNDPLPEEDSLELLVQAQEKSAQKLKTLLIDLQKFRDQEARCVNTQANMDDLYRLSECALKVKQEIAECYVEPYFRPQFLEDLEKLSKAAEKKNLPLLTK